VDAVVRQQHDVAGAAADRYFFTVTSHDEAAVLFIANVQRTPTTNVARARLRTPARDLQRSVGVPAELDGSTRRLHDVVLVEENYL